MASIKIGGISLAGFAFGGNSGVVTPKKIETAIRTPQVTQEVALVLKEEKRLALIGATTTTSTTTILPTTTTTTTQQQSQWLLLNNIWNDNGVWDDAQNWTE